MTDTKHATTIDHLDRALRRGTLDRRSILALASAGFASLVAGCGSGNGGSGAASGGSGAASGGSGAASGGMAGAASGGTAGAGGSSAAAGMGGVGGGTPGCAITEDNILGPFYKADAPFRTDLTADVSDGVLLEVKGRVTAPDCTTPLVDAEVDVWQANADGDYDNQGYVLRGKTRTDSDGRYQFTTIIPGHYLNGADFRPAHVHYKVSHPNAVALTTQLYFEGDPYIPIDPFVHPSLVMPLEDGYGRKHCTFDIVLA